MIKRFVTVAVCVLAGCSRQSTPYNEDDVRAFVQPGTTREAIIARFGQPVHDEKNPKFEGGWTGVDEIIYYHIPFGQLPRSKNGDWVFSGFQVRLKDGKAVEWMPSHAN